MGRPAKQNLHGWHRLFLVMSICLGLFMVYFVAGLWPREAAVNQQRETPTVSGWEFFNKKRAEWNQQPFTFDEYEAQVKQDQVDNELYRAELNKTLTERRAKVALKGFAAWIGGSFVLFALLWVLAWVFRGFQNNDRA